MAFQLNAFQDSAFQSQGDGGEPEPPQPPAVEVRERAVSGRRKYRIIEDPDRLLEELRKEEKIVEKDKKKLVVLFKQKAKAEGFLYQQIQHQVEKLEAKIDDRAEKMALLIANIQSVMDHHELEALEDEEDELLLLS